MGMWITVSPAENTAVWECYAWKGNPILLDWKGKIELVVLDNDAQVHRLEYSSSQVKITSLHDSFFRFQVKSAAAGNVRCRYASPHLAMVSYASLYNRLAIPWQKRLYHQNQLDKLNPTANDYHPELPQVGEQITGVPYVWGGKQSLQEIVRKLSQHPTNQSWLSVRVQYPDVPCVNLDEGESAWDSPKGTEFPSIWCGLDCSGLVEQCARYAGLQYNWRQAPLVASGTYQGIDHYEQLQPGDVIMILKKGILVHFGILSKKGSSVRTTKMIHTVWFTNYRLHHNSVLKTIETPLAELSNQYEYQFVRLNPW